MLPALRYDDKLQRPVRMNEHLCIPINPLIKLLIRSRRIININVVRHHEARLSLPCNYQIPKIAVVFLDVALAGPKSEPL